jgi:DNA-binding transcriptional regulator LsrR (DeoR family)
MARQKLARVRIQSVKAAAHVGSAGRQVLQAKRELAQQLLRVLKEEKLSQSELARRMRTSRAVVHRLLQGDDPSVTLATISRAAQALGRTLSVRIKR